MKTIIIKEQSADAFLQKYSPEKFSIQKNMNCGISELSHEIKLLPQSFYIYSDRGIDIGDTIKYRFKENSMKSNLDLYTEYTYIVEAYDDIQLICNRVGKNTEHIKND